MMDRTLRMRWALGAGVLLGLTLLVTDADPAAADRGRRSRSGWSRGCDDRRSSSYYRRSSWGYPGRYAFDNGRGRNGWRRSRWDDDCGRRSSWRNSRRGRSSGRYVYWR